MEYIQTIEQAMDYIEIHLLDSVLFEDVAAMLHISKYHFHRIFSMTAGVSVHEYIRNRWLSQAGEAFLETDIKVIEAALKYGYSTPESFTRAFVHFHAARPVIL